MLKVKTHLMFQGEAEKAIDLYRHVFKDFNVKEIDRYGPSEALEEGVLKTALIFFAGHELVIFNSPPVHKFTFTPSMSLFVDFEKREDLESASKLLSENGETMMEVGDYGFSQSFSWIRDCFGVSWQLNLP